MKINPIYLAELSREEIDRLTPLPYPTEEEVWLWHQQYKKQQQKARQRARDAADDNIEDGPAD